MGQKKRGQVHVSNQIQLINNPRLLAGAGRSVALTLAAVLRAVSVERTVPVPIAKKKRTISKYLFLRMQQWTVYLPCMCLSGSLN
jgi:hypothetical protein